MSAKPFHDWIFVLEYHLLEIRSYITNTTQIVYLAKERSSGFGGTDNGRITIYDHYSHHSFTIKYHISKENENTANGPERKKNECTACCKS